MPRRLARVAAREQRLGEIQPRVAAAAFAAGPGEPFEIVELGRCGGARESLVQVGVAQVNHAEHQVRLRPALAVEAGVLEQAGRLLVAALLVELHRRIDRVFHPPSGTADIQADGECYQREKQAHGVSSSASRCTAGPTRPPGRETRSPRQANR